MTVYIDVSLYEWYSWVIYVTCLSFGLALEQETRGFRTNIQISKPQTVMSAGDVGEAYNVKCQSRGYYGQNSEIIEEDILYYNKCVVSVSMKSFAGRRREDHNLRFTNRYNINNLAQ